MDGRRHSVDVPISRALIALRRVRSLRDPSTNSMSKFSTLLENVNWETNSTNDISLQFLGACQPPDPERSSFSGLKSSALNRKDEDFDDFDLHSNLGKSKPNVISGENLAVDENLGALVKTKKLDGQDDCPMNGEDTPGNKALTERYYNNNVSNGLELACLSPSVNCLEDVDSTNELILGSSNVEHTNRSISRKKSQYKSQVRAYGVMGDILSRVGSPCLSASDALSSHGMSALANEVTDFMENDHGCGISCCWSRTLRFGEPNPYLDAEGHPLLFKEVDDSLQDHHKSRKFITCETPRSFSQKFRPKTFDELVGQSAVSRSLLSAISKGRVTSLYLFHGPRGTGKTCASRIFAAALNCLSLEEYKPCGLCRECVSFFSGRSKDVKEVDAVRINRVDRIRSLIKNAGIPPVSSRFKVFIIDECHLLRGETWATLGNSLDNISQHSVFLMITSDLDKVPRNAVMRSQRYHFAEVKDSDIAARLGSICGQEGIDFDQAALDFIAAISNGSVRDAEIMLDQLCLLGKRITVSLASELIGVVSDDELLNLLDLALSSDTSNTVIKARELMKSRVDPMQLVSQLVNLIMDVLADKGQENSSEVRRKFSKAHASEVDKQRLSSALKILSETEKQLRLAKNQSTWLTVALLQLSSLESNPPDVNDNNSSLRVSQERDGEFCCTSSTATGESLKLLLSCSCKDHQSNSLGMQGDCKSALESIWKNTVNLCQPKSLKKFLKKQGKLSSLSINRDLVLAELEFHHPEHVSKAEKSWKMIATSLQTILGRNVEIRINQIVSAPASKHSKLSKFPRSLFSCSRRMQHRSQMSLECESYCNCEDHIVEKPMVTDKAILSCDCGSKTPYNYYPGVEVVKALRNSDGNVLSVGTTSSHRSLQEDSLKTPAYGIDSSKEGACNLEYEVFSDREIEDQSKCFPRTLRSQKRLHSSDFSGVISMSNDQKSKLAFSLPGNNCTKSGSEDDLRENSSALCCKTPNYSNKTLHLAHQQRRSPLVGWVLSCGSRK